MSGGTLRPIDVVVASVGQRDVRTLPSSAVRGKPPRLDHYPWSHPVFGKEGGHDLRSYAGRARRWLREEDDRAGVAVRVELPLLDRILGHTGRRQPGRPPALVLVTTDQPDPAFQPGDTVDLGEFIKDVLEAREDGLAGRVEVFPVKANPILVLDVWEYVRPLVGIVADASGQAAPHVAIAAQGGTPALSTALVVLFAALVRGRLESDRRGWEVSELVLSGTPARPAVNVCGRTALLATVDW